MPRTVSIAKLRIGQRFSWIPAEWYGPCRLTEKRKQCEAEIAFYRNGYPITVKSAKYDLKFDAAVVNPPGVAYGVPGTIRVRLLAQKKD